MDMSSPERPHPMNHHPARTRLTSIVSHTPWWSAALALLGAGVAGTALLKLIVTRPTTWSINIYTGDTPLSLQPARPGMLPVLRAEDVHDIPARYVADPFMLRVDDTWYMFCEIMHAAANLGKIGLATSRDGLTWEYQSMVLDEPFHLSYPYVFRWQDQYYMLPESHQDQSVRLYRADTFPTHWSLVGRLLQGQPYMDPTPFYHQGRWWLFVSPGFNNDRLHLFSANDLSGSWHEHPCSPLIEGNPHSARPAGRILQWQGRLFRFAQDCTPNYGTSVSAFEITHLSTSEYAERPALQHPLLQPGKTGWNASGMHHIDLHQSDDGRWIACVDGWRPRWSVLGHELFPLKEAANATTATTR